MVTFAALQQHREQMCSMMSPDAVGRRQPCRRNPKRTMCPVHVSLKVVCMTREPWYSRGIRQRLYNVSQEQDWRGRHAIHIDGYGEDKHIPYTQLLASSVFCLAVPGVCRPALPGQGDTNVLSVCRLLCNMEHRTTALVSEHDKALRRQSMPLMSVLVLLR